MGFEELSACMDMRKFDYAILCFRDECKRSALLGDGDGRCGDTRFWRHNRELSVLGDVVTDPLNR